MIRSAYSDRLRVQTEVADEEPRTKQSFKAECDVNNILEKFQRTGIIEHVKRFGGQYAFADAIDFKEAMDIVAHGQSMFEALPSSVRARFNGDPGQFLDFVQDPDNVQELVKLGLSKAKLEEVVPNPAPTEESLAGEGQEPA